MKRLKTLIVEDEPTEMLYLSDLLKDHGDILEIAGRAESYKQALDLLSDNYFQLSILDYHLGKGKTLFDLVDAVGKAKLGLIVYTSGKKELDIEKILEIKPDFRLYKPYDEDSVSEFVIKLKKYFELTNASERNSIILLDKGLRIKMPFENIYYVRGAKNYCEFICKDEIEKYKTYTNSEGSIGHFEYLLETGLFIKCHRSFFFNKNLIKGVKKATEEIYFDLDGKIPPANYSEWFKEWLDNNGY